MTVILYAILLAHLNSYKDHYVNIGITFAITYAMKRLVRVAGAKDNADLVGLGGYSLTIGEFVKMLGAIKSSGFKGNSESSQKIIDGVVGQGVDWVKNLFQ